MTVQQLIDKLNQLPDKTLPVTRADYSMCDTFEISEVVVTTDDSESDRTIVELRSNGD